MKISKFALACVAVLALAYPLSSAKATELADWTFENVAKLPLTDSTDYSYGPSDTGTGLTGGGHHASANTDWSYPAGSGSARALSSNNWAVGDYWQFSISTLGFENIKIAFDTLGSGTGPRDFKVAYSTNGTTFTDLPSGTYTVSTSFANKVFDFSSITATDNAATVFFRLIDTSTTNINGLAGGVSTAGSNRIDNFIVTGDALVPVPEPSTVIGGFLAAGILFWHQRRRLSRWVGLRATA